jgi:hypothetical protein
MRQMFALAACVAFAPSVANAATCEESFAKKGNPVLGLKFSASVALKDLTAASAVGQMRGIAITKGYDILAEEAAEGAMLMEQPRTGKARSFPLVMSTVQAGALGVVTLEAKLPAGMTAGADGARTELCSMLNQLLGGKQGLAAAARSKSAVSTVAPVAYTAQELSQLLSKESERSAESIPLRYQGKVMILSGNVDYVRKDGGQYRVAFKILAPHELAFRPPGLADFKTDISCLLADGQSVFALQLKPGKSVKLRGTYRDYDDIRDVMWLDGCKPVS